MTFLPVPLTDGPLGTQNDMCQELSATYFVVKSSGMYAGFGKLSPPSLAAPVEANE